jgi:hypothetical protein
MRALAAPPFWGNSGRSASIKNESTKSMIWLTYDAVDQVSYEGIAKGLRSMQTPARGFDGSA